MALYQLQQNSRIRRAETNASNVFAKRCQQVAFVWGPASTEHNPNGSGDALLEAALTPTRADDKGRTRSSPEASQSADRSESSARMDLPFFGEGSSQQKSENRGTATGVHRSINAAFSNWRQMLEIHQGRHQHEKRLEAHFLLRERTVFSPSSTRGSARYGFPSTNLRSPHLWRQFTISPPGGSEHFFRKNRHLPECLRS
jgi:hypothetical protein